MTNRTETKDKEDEGQLGGTDPVLLPENLSQTISGSFLICTLGRESKSEQKQMNIPVNFYAYRMVNEHKKTFGFCLLF